MALKVLGIDNVMLAAASVDEAIDFYGNRLGLPIKFAFPQVGLVAFSLGPEEPALVVRQQEVSNPTARETPRVGLEVPDAHAAAEELDILAVERIGVPFEINTGWVVEFRDPWGNVFGLADYTKSPEKARQATVWQQA